MPTFLLAPCGVKTSVFCPSQKMQQHYNSLDITAPL